MYQAGMKKIETNERESKKKEEKIKTKRERK
jgi:hypothetical protein